LVGWALDFWGKRKTLVVGTTVVVIALFLIGTIEEIGLTAYAARFVFGMGAGALFSGYFALATDLIPETRRTEGLAIFGIFGLIPLAVNPIIGRAGFADAELRYYFPMLGIIVLSSIFFLVGSGKTKPTSATRGKVEVKVKDVLRALMARPLWSLWCATIAFASMVTIFIAFATVAAEARGIENPAWLWATYGTGAVGVRVIGARLPDQLGPHNLVAPALAAYGMACVLMSGASTQPEMLMAGALAGVGHGYCFPVLVSQVMSRISAQFRGSSMAMFTALWEMSAVMTGPGFGSYADAYSDQAMFALAALVALVGLVAWAILEHGYSSIKDAETKSPHFET
jgi:MFS family permease